MERTPKYRTIAQPIGVDIVALADFGGDLGDPVGAAIKVNRYTVVQVVAPADRENWDQSREELFREETRRLARTHPLLGRDGSVSVVFDPRQVSTDDGTEVGEPIQRP